VIPGIQPGFPHFYLCCLVAEGDVFFLFEHFSVFNFLSHQGAALGLGLKHVARWEDWHFSTFPFAGGGYPEEVRGIGTAFCQVFACVNREETSFKEPVLAATTTQLSITLQDRNWRLEDKVGLGQAAIAGKLSSMERSCLQRVGCAWEWWTTQTPFFVPSVSFRTSYLVALVAVTLAPIVALPHTGRGDEGPGEHPGSWGAGCKSIPPPPAPEHLPELHWGLDEKESSFPEALKQRDSQHLVLSIDLKGLPKPAVEVPTKPFAI